MADRSSRDLFPGLGAAIRARREELGMTLNDVAELAATGAAAVSKVEREQRAPSARLLIEIASALSITVDALAASARALSDHPSRR